MTIFVTVLTERELHNSFSHPYSICSYFNWHILWLTSQFVFQFFLAPPLGCCYTFLSFFAVSTIPLLFLLGNTLCIPQSEPVRWVGWDFQVIHIKDKRYQLFVFTSHWVCQFIFSKQRSFFSNYNMYTSLITTVPLCNLSASTHAVSVFAEVVLQGWEKRLYSDHGVLMPLCTSWITKSSQFV